jgi:hypothetical protein
VAVVARIAFVFRSVLLAALVAGLVVPAGASASVDTTWDQAAADSAFPVFKPGDTLGLKLTSLSLPGCASVAATYGSKRSSRGWFSLRESFPLCGNPGEERVVRHVTINGVRVAVAVFCRRTSCDVTARDGVRTGFRLLWRKGAAKRTFIDLQTRRLTLSQVLRVARSLTRVTLNRPTLQLLSFLSPDRQVWCGIVSAPPASAFCGTRSASEFAEVLGDGTVTICNHPNPTPEQVCLQNFDDRAPVLNVGQASEVGGFRCVSELAGITCILVGGGQGFTINAGAVAPL